MMSVNIINQSPMMLAREGHIGKKVGVLDEEMYVTALSYQSKPDDIRQTDLPDPSYIVSTSISLCLSYKHILKIENLNGFRRLKMLFLDNNMITKIENIDHLVHLQRLDLSFNFIEEIEGLDKLENLEDLSLYSNKISKIKGLSSCKKLQCFSLGRNRLSNLDELLLLRKNTELQALVMEENPFCKDQHYKLYALAFLKSLKFLDYNTLNLLEIKTAQDQFSKEIFELECTDIFECAQLSQKMQADAYEKDLENANLIVTKTLFSDMLNVDNEIPKLRELPGFEGILKELEHSMSSTAEEFKIAGLKNWALKLEQVSLYQEAANALKNYYSNFSVQEIEMFLRKKKLTLSLMCSGDSLLRRQLAEDLRKKLKNLKNILLEYEIEQRDGLVDLLGQLESNYGKLRLKWSNLQSLFFRSCEHHEEQYFQSILQLASEMIEKYLKRELSEDISQELSHLLIDRDSCMSCVNGSHDAHIGKLLEVEDKTSASESDNMKNILQRFSEEESLSTQKRINEIKNFIDANSSELEEILLERSVDDSEDIVGNQ